MTLISAKLVPSGTTVQLAPGQESRIPVPREAVPRYGMVQLMRQTDGTYLPVLKTWSETVRLTCSLPNDLGLDVSYNTLVRLVTAGFVQGTRIAPETTLIDLESLVAHMEACRDPEYWTPARVQKYREALRG
jgi:hypothetical protein